MAGNVWQWLEDCYAEDTYAAPPDSGSPAPAKDGCNRVVRGGSWYGTPDNARAAVRVGNTPDSRNGDIGFRVARVLVPPRTL
jgi:formylglycine-generating enzyme required for sulfatase activity